MPDPKKKKKKSASKGTSGLVQVPASGGGAKYVSKSGAAGKRAQKGAQAARLKASGKRLLRSEQLALSKSFNPTKVRQSSSTVKKASAKAISGMSKAIAGTKGRRKK